MPGLYRSFTKLRACAVLAALCAMGVSGVARAQGTVSTGDEGVRAPKLLFIGIDGLRPDAMEVSETPNLSWLRINGAYASDAQAEDLTFSGPNWSTILHGVHRDRHNVTTNEYRRARIEEWPDLFARLEAHNPALHTARLVTWDAIQKFQPTGADLALYHDYTEEGDRVMTEAAASLLKGEHPEQTGDIDALFLYLGDVDVAGHEFGFHPDKHGYRDAIVRADEQVGLVLRAMRERETFEDENWLVIVTTDHGGSIDGQHAGNTPEKRTIPFIVWGREIRPHSIFPGPKNVDGVKTALYHMGVPPEAMEDLDGNIVGFVPTSRPIARLGANLIYNGDAEDDRGFHTTEIDQAISGWMDPGPGGMTVIFYGAPEGFPGEESPGPDAGLRGLNFFAGGNRERSTLTQMIDVSVLRETIEAGEVAYELSGWLGGYLDQEDHAMVRVRFLSDPGVELGVATIGPVTAAERAGVTGLFERRERGSVPRGTRRVEMMVIAERAPEGGGASNDGYADHLSLIFTNRSE